MLFRDFTGKGQYIDSSVHGACALTTEMHVATWIYNNRGVKRQTRRHASADPGPRTMYQTNGGRYLNSGGVLRVSPQRLTVYIDWMASYGLAQDLTDPKYQDAAVIQANQAHIAAVLEHFFANISAEEGYHGAQQREFPTGAVRAVEENLEDPHWHDRGFFVEVEHPELGEKFV